MGVVEFYRTKSCPKCQTATNLSAAACTGCGHRFSSNFEPYVKLLSGNKYRQALEAFESRVKNYLAVGKIGPEEVSALRLYQKSLGLSDESTFDIRSRAFLYLVEVMAYNNAPYIGEWARKYLDWFGLDGIADEWLTIAFSVLATYLIQLDIGRGILPIQPSPMIRLKQGEVCHLEIGGWLVEHQVVDSGVRGGYAGVSVPIYKGVRANFGGSDRRYYSEKDYVPTSSGTLSLTSSRIVYMGNPKGFALNWSQLVAAEPSEHGIVFFSSTRSTPYIFMPTSDLFVGAVIAICYAYA